MDELIKCSVSKKCGGCRYIGTEYDKQLLEKEQYVWKLLHDYGRVSKIVGMKEPLYYRNKVHHAFAYDRKKGIISGCYEANTHKVVDITKCLIEDEKCQEIIETVKKLCVSFKIKTYDEDYEKLCPWAQVTASGQEWPTEMVDAVVEAMPSEENNREQRQKKKSKRTEKK